MKIRIKGNSIRIRLSRTEVELLATEGKVEEHTQMPGGTFRYVLQSQDGIAHLEAGYTHGTINMFIPTDAATAWPYNEIVGFEHNLPLDGGHSLYLLLEKDFKCVDAAVKEDQSDNYENPTLSCE